MVRAKLVPVLLALTLVAASGCLGVGGPTDGTDGTGDGTTAAITSGMNGSEIESAVGSATVESYEFTFDSTISSPSYNSSSTLEGVVDRGDQRVRIESTSTYQDQRTSTEVVVDGSVVYSKQEDADEWNRYNQSRLSGASWDQFDQLSLITELLDHTDATVVGAETVEGTPVTVLEVNPDMETYLEVTAGEDVASGSESQANTSVTLRVTVANETARPQTAELRMTSTNSLETSERTTSMTFSGYNDGATIETPQETVSRDPGGRTASDEEVVTVTTIAAPSDDDVTTLPAPDEDDE